MKRTLPQLLCVVSLAMLSGVTVKAAVIQTQIHPAAGSAPVVIAVLSDHYTDQIEFNLDAANFITYGLLADPYYASHAADLQIVTFYEPLAAGAESNYGFNVEVPSSNCALSWANDTATKVETVVSGINPIHTIVIGDHPYDIGCTDGDWTYVAVDAVGSDVLMHEMGHALARLFDEWALDSNAGKAHPGSIAVTDTRNCFDTNNTAPPHWHLLPGVTNEPGCDLYESGVRHPFKDCRMGATHAATFCTVCAMNMAATFDYLRNPETWNPDKNPDIENPDVTNPVPSKPTNLRIVKTAFELQPVKPLPRPVPVPPRPILRLVISFDPSTYAIVAKQGFPITARYIPSYRRLGNLVYEILDFDRTVDVGVWPSNLFESHGYQGGARHQTSTGSADVTLQLPDVTREWSRDPKHSLSVRIYRLAPNVTEKLITPAVFAKLKLSKQAERVAELNAAQIRAVM